MKQEIEKLPQKVHRAYLLREAEHFREHKKGIPEWIKNSDDSYVRHEEFNKTSFKNIPILINITKDTISSLDFGGANSKDIIEHLPFYGSPDAATQGKNLITKAVSGGHGNGGKYYALSQFKECLIINYYQGKLTILKLDKEGEFVITKDQKVNPKDAIEVIGFNKWPYFGKEGKDLFLKITKGTLGFFCWKGIEPKDRKSFLSKKETSKLLLSISNHPQSRSALRTREVSILQDGKL